MLLCLLGKNTLNKLRREAFLNDGTIVMTEHDYSEALKAEFEMKIQSEAFGLNQNIFI